MTYEITMERGLVVDGDKFEDAGYSLLTITGDEREVVGSRIASRVYDAVYGGRAPCVERLLEYVEPARAAFPERVLPRDVVPPPLRRGEAHYDASDYQRIADAWASELTGIGALSDRATKDHLDALVYSYQWDPSKATGKQLDEYCEVMGVPRVEPDVALRERIRYVAGSSRELEVAQGESLEVLAARHGLKRRGA